MRRTKEDPEKTRTTILLTAEELFLERGVSHTNLEQVARVVGVARGAVYWHFQNKTHLFNEIFNQVRLPSEQFIERLFGHDGSDPLRSLYDLCLEVVQSLLTQKEKRRILTILTQRCEFTEELRGVQEHNNTFMQMFIKFCEQLFARDEYHVQLYPGMTPRVASRALYALILGLFNDWSRDPCLFDPDTDVGHLLGPVFRGLVCNWGQANSAPQPPSWIASSAQVLSNRLAARTSPAPRFIWTSAAESSVCTVWVIACTQWLQVVP